MGAVTVAVIAAKEKQIVEAFRRTGATSPAAAVSPAKIGVAERVAFRRLCDRAVLRTASVGAFYLDEPSWLALRALRRRTVLFGLLVVVIAAIMIWLRLR